MLCLHRELLQRAVVGVGGTLDRRDRFVRRGGIFVQRVWVNIEEESRE